MWAGSPHPLTKQSERETIKEEAGNLHPFIKQSERETIKEEAGTLGLLEMVLAVTI